MARLSIVMASIRAGKYREYSSGGFGGDDRRMAANDSNDSKGINRTLAGLRGLSGLSGFIRWRHRSIYSVWGLFGLGAVILILSNKRNE